ncbi:hypothetical protein [Pollutimonas bauzanensis]|uniref:Uncharacterized protein n=1 Tax=Pollutimonas bauzanensis TaxID=658167 RepID=A0A1M5YHB3_9BURK|nr:hypothetical protein [Pollutimonas bauzanensis]SHI11405.1 hypothetical protein SAMN04488135_10990 [Pollutimonas bauzanensis]
MRPLLGKPISIRISQEEHQRYMHAAADLGMTFSEYVRLRLVSVGDDYVADQIAQLRLTLLDNISPIEEDTFPMTLELLLLMRRICKPADVGMVRAELQRLGYTPWAAPTVITDTSST